MDKIPELRLLGSVRRIPTRAPQALANDDASQSIEPESGRFSRPSCPICDCPPDASLPAPLPWRLAWCGECQFGFLTNPPRYEALTEEFEWDRSLAEEQERRHAAHGRVGSRIASTTARVKQGYRKLTKRDKLLALATECRLTGEVIDIGCGDGHMFASLPTGCVPIGIELSPVLAAQARGRLGDSGGRLIEADALGGLRQLPDASANGAIAISFLEHEASPVETLRELRRVLRPGGSFILKVPNYACWNRVVRGIRWCGFRFPDHVNYFTPRALRLIFERNGFEIARFGFADRLPTSDNMWCVARVSR